MGRQVAAWMGACVLALAAAPMQAAAAAADPSTPGPHAVAGLTYEFPQNAVVDVTGDGIADIPYPVNVAAVVWYPSAGTTRNLPLVLMVHGRHAPLTTPSHRGFDYLAERLASWGFVVASIDARDTQRPGNGFTDVLERGRLIQAHLQCWRDWGQGLAGPSWCNSPDMGARFAQRVDLSRIGLLGHSQGGEAVRAAHRFNREAAQPFALRAIYEIAPKDEVPFGTPPLDAGDLAWSVLLPGCDGDVPDLEGMRVYDRAQRLDETLRRAPKAQQFLFGARHNLFNALWEAEPLDDGACAGQVRLDRAQHESAARVYVSGFFRSFLRGDPFLDLFTGEQAPPAAVQTVVDQSFAHSRGAVLLIDDFSGPAAPFVNAMGGTNSWIGLSVQPCNNDPLRPLHTEGRCAGTDPVTHISNNWAHDPLQHAAKIVWLPSTSLTELVMSFGARDLSRHGYLSLRVAEQNSALNPVPPEVLDFTVRLIAPGGAVSSPTQMSDWVTLRPPVFVPGEFGGVSVPGRSILKTARIPLAAFGAIDLRAVAGLVFSFHRRPEGAIFLADLAFTDVRGDLDHDGDVDTADLQVLLAALGTTVPAGVRDPRDVDGDGRITVLDARRLALLCTRPRCAP